MHILYRQQNYRNIRLDESNIDSETVGVLCKSGSLKQVRWKGFIQRDKARALKRAKPVLLALSRIDGIDVKPGHYAQGCYMDDGVYVVVSSTIATVRKP